MNRLTLKQRAEMATIYIEKYQLVMLSQIAYLQTRFYFVCQHLKAVLSYPVHRKPNRDSSNRVV